MKKQQHHQDCPFCKGVTEKPSFFIEENQSYLSLTNISPDSEGHVLIITKKPRTDITELTQAEGEELLPILKSTINKLENTLTPQGFSLFSNKGKEVGARQAVFHFHLHVVPEGKGSRGIGYLRKPGHIPSLQEYEEIKKSVQTRHGIFKENNKALASLADREKSSDKGHIIISSKEPIKNNFNQVDIETWVQMGELLRESIKRIEKQLAVESFRTCIFLGKIGSLDKLGSSNLQIHLVPRYAAKDAKAKEIIPVSEEIIELTGKLRQASSEPKTANIFEEAETNKKKEESHQILQLRSRIEDLEQKLSGLQIEQHGSILQAELPNLNKQG